MPERDEFFEGRGRRWPVVGILLVAAALLLHRLAGESLWGDEIFTAIFAALPPRDLIAWTAGDIHPPLYYLIASLPSRSEWLWPPGAPSAATDWLWRWPSVLAGLLAVAVTYRLGRETLGQRAGVLAAALLAVAPIALKYGQEARMHGLFMCLSALATLSLVLAWRKGGWRRWAGYALVTAANLYTMYFAFLVVAAHAAWVTARLLAARSGGKGVATGSSRGGRFKNLLAWGAALAVAFLLYGPWWPVLFDIVSRRAALGAVEGGVGAPLAFLRKVVEAVGSPNVGGAWFFFGLYLVGLIWAARQRRWALVALGTAWLALPAMLPLALGDPRALHLRYAFVLPVFLLLAAAALLWFGRWLAAKRWVASRWSLVYVSWIAVTISLYGALTIFAQSKPDWRGAAQYLARNAAPGDVIVTGPLWDDGRFLGYYYRGPAELTAPAGLVASLPERAESLRAIGGRVWLVARFAPEFGQALRPVAFPGLVVLEPEVVVYEPPVLEAAMVEFCRQAVEAAFPWAGAMAAGGVLNPDPRPAQALAYLCLGDTLLAAGRVEEALEPYRAMVEVFPGWVNGYVTLAEAYEALGNMPAAAETYGRAVAFNPDWRNSLADRAGSLADRGEVEAALAIYHQLIDGR
ncbi:MAG: glycosyltransferase family 39 protein [Anaerolineae bacterium]